MKAKRNQRSGKPSAGQKKEKTPAAAETVVAAVEEKACPVVAVADDAVFERRLARHQDELKWLYCELYHGDMAAFF